MVSLQYCMCAGEAEDIRGSFYSGNGPWRGARLGSPTSLVEVATGRSWRCVVQSEYHGTASQTTNGVGGRGL
jgi:hypothetical protein